MSRHLELQIESENNQIPDSSLLQLWFEHVLDDQNVTDAEIAIRVVDESEGRELNLQYRGKDYATNVLSFVFEAPPGLPAEALGSDLGDLVICAPVVVHEAMEQSKQTEHHWAHLVIHGTLHLLGYDHIDQEDAEQMELIETRILGKLGISDPYQIETEDKDK